jgi:dTDP-4-amino-4,6-dideoxygalactose transaminase
MNRIRTVHVEAPDIIDITHLMSVPQFPGVIGTFMGRDALSLGISALALSKDDTVLLPVYTCREVLNSFIRSTRVLFYDVSPDLTIDPDEVAAKMREGNITVMMITNYFGFLQPYRSTIKKLCADRGISLIEDCAHSLLTHGSGETGDLAIYSFRKILPLPDGGGLRVNGHGRPPPPKYYPQVYSDAISVLIKVKSLLNVRTEMFSRARIGARASKVLSNVPLAKGDARFLPLSYFAQARMANMSFPEIINRRRNDFQFWQEVTRRVASLIPIFSTLPSGVCPFGFAVRVKDRGLLESRARNRGIHLSVHWRLDPMLAQECSTSHELSKDILTLPVYPALREKDRDILAEIVTCK